MKRLAVLLALLLLAGCVPQAQPERREKTASPGPAAANPSTRPGESGAPGTDAIRTLPVTIQAGPAAPPLRAVRFVSPQVGWAGGNGVILATADGGRNWQQQYTGPVAVSALEFVDARHGWAVAEDALLHTADGGQTWAPVSVPAQPLHAVDLVTPTLGWAVAGERLYQTADAGRTWAPAPAPAPVESICFAGGTTGWAAGKNTVLRTADGGRTWRTAFAAPVTGSGWRAAIRCGGAEDAWLLLLGGVGMSQQAYVAFRTADAGATWAPILANGYFSGAYPTVKVAAHIDAYAGPFTAVDAARAMFLGDCPACGSGTVSITRTFDGGATWQRDNIAGLHGGSPQFAIAFVDAQRGWLAGARDGRGLILATSDGGRTWQQQYPVSGPVPSVAISFANEKVGYGLGTVGDGSAILRTDDGGKSWTKIATFPGGSRLVSATVPPLWLSFVDERHGWAIAPTGQLMRTGDGGSQWQPVEVPPANGIFRGVKFATQEAGCVENLAGRHFGTTDGGANWQAADGVGGVAACAARLAGKQWVLTLPPLPQKVWTWTVLDTPGPAGAWALLNGRPLLATGDGGKTWTQFDWPETGYSLQSVSFVDATRGWALTTGGLMLQTTDGGATWRQVHPEGR